MLDNLVQEVKQMLARMTGMEPEEIEMEADLIEDLGIDSLKVIEIATDIERTYKVVVKDSDLIKLRKVREAVDLLQNLLDKKAERAT